MKRLIFAVLLFASLAMAQQTKTLQWDANPAGDNVQGYRIYEAPAATGPWTKIGETAAIQLAVNPVGLKYYRVTAYNVAGESAPGNTVASDLLPGAPKNTRIVVSVVVVP